MTLKKVVTYSSKSRHPISHVFTCFWLFSSYPLWNTIAINNRIYEFWQIRLYWRSVSVQTI